jgi:hypothetical protein
MLRITCSPNIVQLLINYQAMYVASVLFYLYRYIFFQLTFVS